MVILRLDRSPFPEVLDLKTRNSLPLSYEWFSRELFELAEIYFGLLVYSSLPPLKTSSACFSQTILCIYKRDVEQRDAFERRQGNGT